MSARQTLIVTGLTDSAAAYEDLGNEMVAEVIGTVTQWMARVCSAYGGRTIRPTGSGVLALFPSSIQAVSAAVFLQKNYQGTRGSWPKSLQAMGLKIGVASGSVVQVEGDVFGEAVGLASSLCDLAGADTIWADQTVVDGLPDSVPADPLPLPSSGVSLLRSEAVRYRLLGPVRLGEPAGMPSVVEIFWQEDVRQDALTRPAALQERPAAPGVAQGSPILTLSMLDVRKDFVLGEHDIQIGRATDNDFVVEDLRVSRVQARISWTRGTVELTDLSSYGSWVRFSNDPGTELALRRNACVLYGSGEIAMGASFADLSAPVIAFELSRS